MRYLVHGLGRFGGGAGAVRYLAARGHQVRVVDKAPAEALAASVQALADLAVDWRLGSEDPAALEGFDALVANPAVADAHPLLAAARQRDIPITQEVNLFLADYPGRVCLITGTNGKSTTSHLLHAALRAGGRDAILGGNIGKSLLDEAALWHREQVAVVEISSFQLERLPPASLPCVEGAVAVRITQDHLDRHGTLAAYHAAKAMVARAARGFFVHAADDPVAAGFATPARERLTYTTSPPADGQVGVVAGTIASRLDGAVGHVLDRAALRLLGEFNLENAMAAFAAAVRLGVSRAAAGVGLATAPPLPYRLQLATTLRDGVRVYDNAVSTDADSTASALRTLRALERGRVLWVGGGKSKDGDFRRAAAILAPHLQAAFLFGAAAEPLAACLADMPTVKCATVPEALDAARRAARPGDVILFSPAFASFDQYANFRARAEHFHGWLAGARLAESQAAGHAAR